jgi:RNA polymerase sigma-70 factor (ECF subfamily)
MFSLNEFALSSESSDKNEEDIFLLKRIGAGDENALSSLYDKYSQLLYSLTLRILRSVDDSEDILHNIFLEMWNKPEAYKPTKGSFYAWFIALTRNHALARKQSMGVQKQHHPGEINQISLHTGFGHKEFSVTPLVKEKRDLILSTMKQLSKEEQQALVLAYYEGYSQLEIAGMIKLPADVIKFRIDDSLTTISSHIRGKM